MSELLRSKWVPHARWFGGVGGFARWGNVSVAWDLTPDDYRPLTERYGTTKTWRWGHLRLRRHGHLHKRDDLP